MSASCPPMLVCSAHPVIDGWLNRIIGWIDAKLEELARYAVDPSSGGGLQSVDYLVLQLLNREIPALIHFQRSGYVHPERLYEELLRLAGELATFATTERRARDYPAYDHDDLENVFAPLIRDIQEFLSARLGRRAIRLEIIERAQNAFVSPIRDRSLFRNATFVLEVAARRPLVEIQNDFPHLFKVGPNTKMNEIVHANLPGLPLVHLPTPPPHIRAITDHVYFYLDRKSQLWPDFSNAASIGMHFSGDWPELELYLWAILRRSTMSDRDKPVNPFGRTERTIIRPNPGGRLPQAPPPPPPAPDPAAENPRAPFSPVPLADTASPSQQPPASQYQPFRSPLHPVALQCFVRSRTHDALPGGVDLITKSAGPKRRTCRPRRHCASMIWSRRMPTRSCGRPDRCLQLLGPSSRRIAARIFRQPDGAGRRRREVLRKGHSLRRYFRAAGQYRQIHSLRDRRRHRSAHPDG